MARHIHNKLVRDMIPQIIERDGRVALTRILDQREYLTQLNNKLIEEAEEFVKEGSLEELADILEVIYALAKELGASVSDLEKLRMRKRNERGGFESKILLIEADVPS